MKHYISIQIDDYCQKGCADGTKPSAALDVEMHRIAYGRMSHEIKERCDTKVTDHKIYGCLWAISMVSFQNLTFVFEWPLNTNLKP